MLARKSDMSWETPRSGQTRMVGYPGYRLPSVRLSKKYSAAAKRVAYHFSEDSEELPTSEKDLSQGTEENVGNA